MTTKDESAQWLDDCAECMEDEGLDRENNARHFRAGAKAIRTLLQQAAEPLPSAGEVGECHEFLKDRFFIVKNGLYYRPEARGYTIDPNQAGIYSNDEAQKHLSSCSELSLKPAYRIIHAAQSAQVEEVTEEEIRKGVQDAIDDVFEQKDLPIDERWHFPNGVLSAAVNFIKKHPHGLRIVRDKKEGE